MLAEGKVAQDVLERMERMSKKYGTEIRVKDGLGYVKV